MGGCARGFWMDERMDGWMNRWTDGQMGGWMDGRTDRTRYQIEQGLRATKGTNRI